MGADVQLKTEQENLDWDRAESIKLEHAKAGVFNLWIMTP